MKFSLSILILSMSLLAASAEVKVTPAANLHELLEKSPEKTIFRFPAGDYKVSGPLDITGSMTFLMERGARLMAEGDDLIRIVGDGEIIIEGIGGFGELVNLKTPDSSMKKDDIYPNFTANVISLEKVPENARPSLILKNIIVRGFTGISGAVSKTKGPMNRVEVSSCRFYCMDAHMAHKYSEVYSLKVEDSSFEGEARVGILFTSPMPGGAVVRGNTLRNVGQTAIQLSGGKVTQVADGCMDYLPSALVENNRILGGGQRAPLARSYIFGILVYGNNVIVRGNIVKDFNRGEKIPDAPYGHRFKLPDGSYYEGIWIATEKDPHRRLAGAAIYLKANRAIIADNICTNSGWRSVIEVKTGGIGPYVLVTGNIVDGSSLSAKDSFGFECSSNHSVWSNNLVYNMPDCAFAVRNNRSNTYLNNVIHNAKIGFLIQGDYPEILLGNRFENVEKPYYGRNGKTIRIDTGRYETPYQPVGENLLLNPELKNTGRSPAPPDWSITVPTAPAGEFITGSREGVFTVGNGDKTSNFLLSQEISLTPGARYRYAGEVAGSGLSLIVRDGKKTHAATPPRTFVDFTVTEPSGKVKIQVHGNNFGKGKQAEIKRLQLHLLKEKTES